MSRLLLRIVIWLLAAAAFEQCPFEDTDSLTDCQTTLLENARETCPEKAWPPPGEAISENQLRPERAVATGSWSRIKSRDIEPVVRQLLIHFLDSDSDAASDINVSDLIKFDYALICIILGVLLLVLAWAFFLPVTCCCPQMLRPTWPSSYYTGVGISSLTFLTILILSSIGIHLIRQTEILQTDVKCFLPGVVYSLPSLEMHDVTIAETSTTFDGLVNLGRLLQNLPASIKYVISYLSSFQGELLGNLAVISTLSPLIFSGANLEQQKFTGWLNSDTHAVPFTLDQFLLGYRSVQEGDWVTTSTDKSFLSPLYTVVSLLFSEVKLDVDGLEDAMQDLLTATEEAEDGFNSIVKMWARLANATWMPKIGAGDSWHHALMLLMAVSAIPLGMMLPAAGLYYYWRSTIDLPTTAPRLSMGVKVLTIFLTVYAILYACILFIAGGAGLTAIKLLKGGCAVFDAALDSKDPELVHLFMQQEYFDVCLANNGTGDLAALWDLQEPLRKIEDLLGSRIRSEALGTTALSVPEEVHSIAESELSTYVLSKFDSERPYLSNTTAEVWWSGLQRSLHRIECWRAVIPADPLHCKALQAEIDAAEKADADLIWLQLKDEFVQEFPQEISVYGLNDLTTSLEAMFIHTKCQPVRLCLQNDRECKWRSADLTIGKATINFIDPELLKDVKANWPVLTKSIPRTSEAKRLFECMDSTGDSPLQTAWIVGVRIAVLKSLTLGELVRDYNDHHSDQTVSQDGFPGWIGIAAPGQTAPLFYSVETTEDSSQLKLLTYTDFQSNFSSTLTALLKTLETSDIPTMAQTLVSSAGRLNPIYVLLKIVDVLSGQYNCQVLGAVARGFTKLTCSQAGPFLSNLFIVWSLLAYAHLLLFTLVYVFWLKRSPITESHRRPSVA